MLNCDAQYVPASRYIFGDVIVPPEYSYMSFSVGSTNSPFLFFQPLAGNKFGLGLFSMYVSTDADIADAVT